MKRIKVKDLVDFIKTAIEEGDITEESEVGVESQCDRCYEDHTYLVDGIMVNDRFDGENFLVILCE